MTTVSVVVPVYNRIRWLWPALRSVLAQTYDDYEVIVVDDGSSEPIELGAGLDDPRIRFVRQEHRGASAARNHGLMLSNGRYVAFLDADDEFLPEKLEVQVHALESNPGIALVHSSYVRMDEQGNDIEMIPSGTFGGRVYPAIVMDCPIATPTVMVRKDVLDQDRLSFDESLRFGEDVIMWINLARGHEILGIDVPLSRVRMDGRNALSDPTAQFEGGMAILRRSFESDPSFGPLVRRRAFARLSANVGHQYVFLHQGSTALRFFLRAATQWPFDWETNVKVVRLIVPQRLRAALRRFRATVR